MNNESLNQVLELIQAEKANEAQLAFNAITPVETVEYYLVKGKLEQKFQNWGNAINAFTKVVEIEPDNIEAQNHLYMIKNILNFWNPEMFNP
jgi:tetratricopeptide (TPR) repeat protein